MPELKWSNALAAEAQKKANDCKPDVHSSSGENLAAASRVSNGAPVLPAMTDQEAFEESWYCEIKNYDFNAPVFKGGFTSDCRDVNGHFTQVVWRDSCYLGCGRATCQIAGQPGTHWVCRYSPPGNVNASDISVLKQQVLPPECK